MRFAPHCVQFFFSHLASWLRTRCFSEPTFRPSGATNHWINTVHRDFLTFFAHLHLLSYAFSSLIFSLLLFSSLPLPTFAFPFVHIVGSLTFKCPSIIVCFRQLFFTWLHDWRRFTDLWRWTQLPMIILPNDCQEKDKSTRKGVW